MESMTRKTELPPAGGENLRGRYAGAAGQNRLGVEGRDRFSGLGG